VTIEGDIAQLIPIGEENAVSARLLWKQLGMWSAQSTKLNWTRWRRQAWSNASVSCVDTTVPICISDRAPEAPL